jgi:hypothetical protein
MIGVRFGQRATHCPLNYFLSCRKFQNMKHFVLTCLTVILLSHAHGQSPTIPLDSVQYYVGKNVTICADVKGTYQSDNGKGNTYINFGKPYPNSTFTVMIFSKDISNFNYNPADRLKGKQVCVTGKVTTYKDKPEIVVSKPDQIVIR